MVEHLDTQERTIEGSLERIDLASVLQVLQSNGSEGILELRNEETVVELFYCTSFGLTLAHRAEALGQLLAARLLNQGSINHEQYDHALSECSAGAGNAVDVLHEMDILDEHHLVDTLRECLEEEIYVLFFLKEAAFEFQPVPFEADRHWGVQSLDPLGVPLDRVVLEAARRIDEWTILEKKIPSLDIIFKPDADRLQEMGEPAPWMQRVVLSLVDSQRTLREIVGLSSLSEFEVCRVVDQLVESGWVSPLSRSELIRAGERLLKRNQVDLAIQFLELALDPEIADPELHDLLARAFERIDGAKEAANHLLEAAELRLSTGEVVTAFENVTSASELVPADLAIAVRKIEIYLDHAVEYSLAAAPTLVDDAIGISRKLIEASQTEKGVEILRRLDAIEKGSLPLKSEMIEILLNRGLITEAIAEYEKLGSFLVARGQLEDAKKIFRKILSLDHRRHDVADHLKKIERMDTRRRGRRRRVLLMVGALAVVGLLAAGYSQYSRKASEIVQHALSQLRDDGNSRTESIEALREVSERFPLAPAARSAGDEIRRLEVERRQESVGAVLERKVQEDEAQGMLDGALDMIDEGQLDEALVRLQQAIDLAPTDTWLAERDLENQKERLLIYLDEAETLYQLGKEAIERRDYDAGFELTRELLDSYPKSPFARTVRVPVRITSMPSGAEVTFNGTVLEQKTPCAVLVDPAIDSTVSLALAGHAGVADAMLDYRQRTFEASLPRRPRWSFSTNGAIVGKPAVDAGVLFVGSRDATIYAIDPTETTELWRTKLSSLADVETDLTQKDDVLYLGANDRRLYALDKKDGSVKWRAAAVGFVKRSPLLRGSVGFFGCSKGQLYAVNLADGSRRWQRSIGAALVLSPAWINGSLVVVNQRGDILTIDPRDGSLRASVALGVPALSASISSDHWLVGTDDGRILSVHPTKGTVTWEFVAKRAMRGAPVVDGDVAYVGGEDGVLRKLALDTGDVVASFPVKGMIRSAPVVREDGVYFGASDHYLYCLDKETLSLRWRGQCGGAIVSTPFEAYGALYVGCADHKLYCFEP